MLLKKIFLFSSIFLLLSCAELQQVVNTIPTETGIGMDSTTIANGLRQALDKGIDKQVTKLTQKDGFYKNQLVKIMLPSELQKVDQGLRDIGLGSLADEGIKALNRAAEDAVKEATPIFVSAVKEITFADAKNIFKCNPLGGDPKDYGNSQLSVQQVLLSAYQLSWILYACPSPQYDLIQ